MDSLKTVTNTPHASTAPPEEMTDRELLVEVVTRMRKTEELVTSFIGAMKNNPMLNMMAGRFGGNGS